MVAGDTAEWRNLTQSRERFQNMRLSGRAEERDPEQTLAVSTKRLRSG